MIECVFTIDYEIYGNGKGSLRDLVWEPAERLRMLFSEANARFVVFPEVAELEMMDTLATDDGIAAVKEQLRDFHRDGFEIGLHMHPWWYNAEYDRGQWRLDDSEYNLCALPSERIEHMVERSIAYLRRTLGAPDFTPLSFRAGHLLFQPARAAASALARHGIKLDSSVYKGGVWPQHKLDYRRALRNGYFWRFTEDSVLPDPNGALLEIPIHTQMVPIWTMLTSKRVGLERRGTTVARAGQKIVARLKAAARLRRPLKFDYCAMTTHEIARMLECVMREDRDDPASYRPLVAIGHTKDLVDYETVASLLSYLKENGIPVSTLAEVYRKCMS